MNIAIPSGMGQPGDSFDPDQGHVLAPEPAEPSVAAEPPAPSGGHWQEEDRTFGGSDIEIRILLFRPDRHPDGRLVQIHIKDFHETSESGTYRERQLTASSSLDQLQEKGINEVFQRFWFRQEEQRKKAAAAASKQKSAPASVGTAPTPAAAPASAPPAVSPPCATVPPKSAPTHNQFEFF